MEGSGSTADETDDEPSRPFTFASGLESMDVQVAFYGNLVRLAGARTRTIRVAGDPPTVRDLRIAVGREVPEMVSHLGHVAVGMGAEILPDEAILRSDGEISLLPPVSGGQGQEWGRYGRE